jgi:hypothetical protein
VQGKEIEVDESFRVNEEFSSKLVKIKVGYTRFAAAFVVRCSCVCVSLSLSVIDTTTISRVLCAQVPLVSMRSAVPESAEVAAAVPEPVEEDRRHAYVS